MQLMQFPSEFLSKFPDLAFGELVELVALVDSVATMYVGVAGELENEGKKMKGKMKIEKKDC